MNEADDPLRADVNRTYWRSRRGMLELDLLLRPFARDQYAALEADLKAQYQALLACDDQDIFAWLQGHAPPSALVPIVSAIRAFNARR
jgi:antitoxin CptB